MADAERGEAAASTQPIGTPDEIIDKIKTLQWAISLETLVIHVFYGGMPLDKAEKSLRLFAEKVLAGGARHGHADQSGVARPLGQLIVVGDPRNGSPSAASRSRPRYQGKGPI